MTLTVLVFVVLALAYANGANDNFKGVATLFGSGTANYRGALLWATLTTFLGSLTAVFLAGQLLKNFSGRGLVDDGLVTSSHYVSAVALGAGLTVLLATKFGMPVSTTHSLVGALVGAGWAAGSAIQVGKLGLDFFSPLLISPLLAMTATCLCYPVLHAARIRLGITEETCFCVGQRVVESSLGLVPTAAVHRMQELSVTVGDAVFCRRRYQGRVLGIEASAVLDRLHYLSAGAVSFARGLNDTPKIAALLLVAPHLGGFTGTLAVATLMAIGGLVSTRRVAEVLSLKITPMNHGQGFAANLTTSVVVIAASHLGLPVSTTHVSCGALFGIGTVTGQAQPRTIVTILAAWVTTLPLAAVLGAAGYWALRHL
jgi:inorganic phosphate transporter, PiT family